MGKPKEKPEGIPIRFSGRLKTWALVQVDVAYVGHEDGTVRVESVGFPGKHARALLRDGELQNLEDESRRHLKKARAEFMRGKK